MDTMSTSSLWEEVRVLLLNNIGMLLKKCPILDPTVLFDIEVLATFWGCYYKILLHQYGLNTLENADTYPFRSIVFPIVH